MKRNLIITVILLVYAVTFILLFVRLRSMSGTVLEELSENNVYYMLGFMFIAGISATMYLIMEANNKQFTLSLAKESESISFDYESKTVNEEMQKEADSNLVQIKHDLETAYKMGNQLSDKLEKTLWKFCAHFEISQALVYVKEKSSDQLTLKASYAFILHETDPRYILTGEGLTGQAVKDRRPYFIKDIPEGYLKVISGLGESLPTMLLIVPCIYNDEVMVVFELSSLKEYSKQVTEEIVSICNYVSELVNQ